MRIKHRFTFPNDSDTEGLISKMHSLGVKYDLPSGNQPVTIEIYEDEENWVIVSELMKYHDILSLKECVYTKAEYNNAMWFTVRSKWRWGYPQPEDKFNYKQITYNDCAYCLSCGSGLLQKAPFQIKSQPSWGRRNFLMLNWIEDELFVNNNAEKLLVNSELKGFKLTPVINNKSKEELKSIKQIQITSILPIGLKRYNDIVASEKECELCGVTKIILAGKGISFFKDTFDGIDVDIVKSFESFGDGLMSSKLIIVSKAFYEFIKAERLDQDLVFQPIMLD